jgi:hypothetical protein
MEYGLPPPGRVKPRRDGKMAKKQDHTMAKAKKVAPGSDRSTDINLTKLEWVTREALAQGKRVYRVDVNFTNAFNAMSQAALWAVMRAYGIPDVDLLMSLYEHSTVRMAPNDLQCATITFDTGSARKCTVPATLPDFHECTVRAANRQRAETAHIPRAQMRGAAAQEGGDSSNRTCREYDDDKRWDDRTDRMTFEVRKGSTPVRSVWTNSVRNAFRKQAGWAKL